MKRMFPQTPSRPLAQWLFFQAENTAPLADQLRAILQSAGYTLYDPFPGGSSAPIGLQQRTRAFLTPARDDWARLIFAPGESWGEALVSEIAAAFNMPLLAAELLSPEERRVAVYRPGQPGDASLEALAPFLRPGLAAADVRRALAGQSGAGAPSGKSSDLPPELQQFADAQGVDSKQVDRLMRQMTRKVFNRLGDQDSDAEKMQTQAKAALTGAGKSDVDWSSGAGRNLLAAMACLSVPDDWHQPDWKTLTAAYQVARQLQRDPRSPLLPGDKEALAALSNALDFIPFYSGKKN
jgi:hypothetical protein